MKAKTCPACRGAVPLPRKAGVLGAWTVRICPCCGAKVQLQPRRRSDAGLPLIAWGSVIAIAAGFAGFLPGVVAGLLVAGAAHVLLEFRMEVIAHGPFCVNCRYDLSAFPGPLRCPECGARTPGRKL